MHGSRRLVPIARLAIHVTLLLTELLGELERLLLGEIAPQVAALDVQADPRIVTRLEPFPRLLLEKAQSQSLAQVSLLRLHRLLLDLIRVHRRWTVLPARWVVLGAGDRPERAPTPGSGLPSSRIPTGVVRVIALLLLLRFIVERVVSIPAEVPAVHPRPGSLARARVPERRPLRVALTVTAARSHPARAASTSTASRDPRDRRRPRRRGSRRRCERRRRRRPRRCRRERRRTTVG